MRRGAASAATCYLRLLRGRNIGESVQSCVQGLQVAATVYHPLADLMTALIHLIITLEISLVVVSERVPEMTVLFWLVLAGQSVAVAPPPAPPWGQAEQYAGSLRQACLSEAGIAIALRDWADGQAASRARQTEYDKIERELGEAAYTMPINVDRLNRAAEARNAYQAAQSAEWTARAIATIRKLSPPDRAIFARRISIYRPSFPARTCAGNVR
jgi:hypothetical protein